MQSKLICHVHPLLTVGIASNFVSAVHIFSLKVVHNFVVRNVKQSFIWTCHLHLQSLNENELTHILKQNTTPLIEFTRKVISTDLDKNTILRIYLCRPDDSLDIIPSGTLYSICPIKTPTTQVVIDSLLSEHYAPLEPVWYSEFSEHMIDKHHIILLHREINNLISHCRDQSCL